jgi:hypothetical protein
MRFCALAARRWGFDDVRLPIDDVRLPQRVHNPAITPIVCLRVERAAYLQHRACYLACSALIALVSSSSIARRNSDDTRLGPRLPLDIAVYLPMPVCLPRVRRTLCARYYYSSRKVDYVV